jgi:hypothetical protein
MKTKRSAEGYLLIDHSASPGLTEAEAHRGGLPVYAGRGLYETSVVNCGHCQKGIIVHPLLMRDVPTCSKCDSYVCESCKLTAVVTGACIPFTRVVDETQERVARGLPITWRPHG